jgi:hypothetical protein
VDLHDGGEALGHHHYKHGTRRNHGKIEVALFLGKSCSQRRVTPLIWCTIAALHRVFPSFFFQRITIVFLSARLALPPA